MGGDGLAVALENKWGAMDWRSPANLNWAKSKGAAFVLHEVMERRKQRACSMKSWNDENNAP